MKSFTIKVTQKEIEETSREEGYNLLDEQIQECLYQLELSALEFIANEARDILWRMSKGQYIVEEG